MAVLGISTRTGQRLPGRPWTKAIDLGWQQRIHPDDLTPFLAQLMYAHQIDEAFCIELRIQAETDEYHWFMIQGVPHASRGATRQHLLLSCVNISPQKAMELELRQSENRMRTILENMPVMLVASDEHHNLLLWNHEAERVTGYQDDEVLGRNYQMQLLLPDEVYRQEAYAQWKHYDGDYRDWELVFVCKDGSRRYIEWSNISRQFPIAGWASWAIGVDITAHRHAQQRLEALQSVVEALSTPLTIEHVGQVIIEEATRVLNALAGTFQVFNQDQQRFEIIYGKSSSVTQEEQAKWQSYPALPEFPATTVIRAQQPLWFSSGAEVALSYPALADIAVRYPGASALIPLIVNEQPHGVLSLVFEQPRSFEETEKDFILALGHHCAQSLERAKLYQREQEMVRVMERQRLARDLQDAVSQVLFVATAISETLPRIWERDPQKAMKQLDHVVSLNRSAMGELRMLLYELQPEAIVTGDWRNQLQHLLNASMGRRTITTRLVFSPNRIILPNNIHYALYRITQESLNNVIRHSHANQVEIYFDADEHTFSLRIVDNGVGFDPEQTPPGSGLRAMRDRAEEVGTRVQLHSSPGQGTHITIEGQWSSRP